MALAPLLLLSAALCAAAPAAAPVRVGLSLVDPRAPGAPRLLEALRQQPPTFVLGAFRPRQAEVLNSFVAGRDGVAIHLQTLPQEFDPANIGGYSFAMAPDGSYEFKASGSVYAPLTPAVQRAILRHLGVKPARESALQRVKRGVLRALDAAAAFGAGPGLAY